MAWVRPFLVGRPVSERAFLLPGPQRWLLMSPSGLPDALPFGTPLSYAGPEQLYLEVGTDFSPPLPTGARRQVFELKSDRVVAVTRAGGFRFDPAHGVPVWALWAGEAPPLAEGLTQGGENLLHRLAEMLRKAQRQALSRPRRRKAKRDDDKTRTRDPEEVLELVKKAELAGNWQLAAELLESIGETGASARLYEGAARL